MLEYVRHILSWWKKPAKKYHSPEYDAYHVMRMIAPPGFISHFMKGDAYKIHPQVGFTVQVPRLDKEWLKHFSVEYKMDEVPERILIDRLELNKYETLLGARLVYAIDTEADRLYYWDSEEFESTAVYFSQRAMQDHLRRLLRLCIKEY